MSADLDAVRKAYDEAWENRHNKGRGLGANDAALTAVVEWAMNRAAEAIPHADWERRGRVLDALDALLKDLTERKN
jgi:hypothetical protein